jgi:hypothetical protein
MLAEEDCALNGHETKSVVCCAKHHLEIPCNTCLEMERQAKDSLKATTQSNVDTV